MAYDNRLAARVRSVLAEEPDVAERSMFGGLAFMVAGNMACGVIHDDLMVRVGADAFDDAMNRPHVRVMDFTHRPSKGMVYVAPAGVRDDRELEGWIARGVRYARSLPSKG